MAYFRQTRQQRPKEAKQLYDSIISLINTVQTNEKSNEKINEKKRMAIQYLNICVSNNILALTVENNKESAISTKNATKIEKYLNKINKILAEFPGIMENQLTVEQKSAILFNKALAMIFSKKEKVNIPFFSFLFFLHIFLKIVFF